MASLQKVFDSLLTGRSDTNVRFADLQRVLRRIGFSERRKGSHFIYAREGIEELVNIQEGQGGRAKAYQVKQIRGYNHEVPPCDKGRGRMKYEVIIYWSNDDAAFIAEVPELPGCMADGSTKAKALRAVEVVAAEWLETAKELGRPIPEPKGRLAYA